MIMVKFSNPKKPGFQSLINPGFVVESGRLSMFWVLGKRVGNPINYLINIRCVIWVTAYASGQ